MSERVIALDPGGRTGWAAAKMDVNRLELMGSGVLEQRAMALWLAEAQGVHGPASTSGFNGPEYALHHVIVAEAWRPRRKNGSMDWIEGDPLLSAQHVGQIRLLAMLSGAKYVEYAPAQKTPFLASMPQVLKDLDVESSEQHDQDARWHLWGYFFENWLDLTELESGTTDLSSLVILP